jgi:cytochrome P450
MRLVAILTLLFIMWALWRPLNAAVSPRFSRAYPDLAVKLRAGFGLVAIPLTALYLFLPGLLWLPATAAAAFILLESWRGRPSWGVRRGLPPGSLKIFPDTWTHNRFYLDQAERHGPIFKTSNFLRPTACVVGLEQGIRVLREQEEKLETPYLPFSEFVPGGMLRYMREPRHSHYRAVFRRALASKIVQGFEPAFREGSKRTLDLICAKGSADKAGVNPVSYLDRMMLELWFQLFFAIERESAECRRLLELYPVIDIANPRKASPRQISKAVRDITAIVEQQFAGWRGDPPPGLLGAILKDNPVDARDPVVIGNLVYMLTTTASDMSALLCWILKKACDHPEWLERMANEPEPKKGSSEPSLAECFVMETLRMRQSEFIYRAVIRDFDCGGFRIPAGWLLRICVWESHRDPNVFAEPDHFNPDRFLGRSYSRSEYSPFGASSHACLASYLVTLLARVFVSELASHFRLKESGESTIELASSRHWAPGPAFRVELQPRR